MPEPIAYVTCSACNRIVEAGHVNRSGRCSLCAGLRQETIEARAAGDIETTIVDPGELAPPDGAGVTADTKEAEDDAPKRKER